MTLLARSTRSRLLLSGLSGLLAAGALMIPVGAELAAMVAITLGELVLLATTWLALWPMDADETRASVAREDLRPRSDEAIVAVVSGLAVASLVALHLGVGGGGATTALGAALTLAGVFGAWACVHLTYAVHYAYRFYEKGRGLDFGGDEPPAYSDFFYLSYTIGMTYGLSDTTATEPGMRTIVLRHGLVSFAFGMIVLGAAVNLVAGMFGLT